MKASGDLLPSSPVQPKDQKVGGADGAVGEPIDTLCMACEDATCDFQPKWLQRRPLGPSDILMQMKFCGVCHTDLHFAANHMSGVMATTYPCVPGHELAGVAIALGPNVTRFDLGDHVGVGCMVDSCLECAACKRGEEQARPYHSLTRP